MILQYLLRPAIPQQYAHYSTSDKKKILTYFRVTSFCSVVILACMPFYLWWQIFAPIVTLSFFLAIILLTQWGVHRSKNPWFFIASGIVFSQFLLLVESLLMGRLSFNHFIFIIFVGLPIIMLPKRLKKSRWLLIFLSTIFLVFIECCYQDIGPFLIGAEEDLEQIQILNLSILAVIVLIQFLAFERESEKQYQEIKQQNAQLLRANQLSSLGTMASGVAHEINNPLSIIIGAAANNVSAADRIDNNKIKSFIDKNNQMISQAVARISDIVSGLKTLSRDDANKEFKKESISKILNDTLSFCDQLLKSKNIKFNSNHENVDFNINGRFVQISQVFLNLIQNSIDALEKEKDKTINIEVKAENGFVLISVTDNGTGVSPAIEKKIFRTFLHNQIGWQRHRARTQSLSRNY